MKELGEENFMIFILWYKEALDCFADLLWLMHSVI